MNLYLDTSALVKKYFYETGSDEVISRWKNAASIATSAVAYAEAMASFYRKKQETDIDESIFNKIIETFHRDWHSFICVEVNNELNISVHEMIEKYLLRGFDSIHLASAVILYKEIPEDFVFGCYDKRLSNAAKSEGLNIFPKA